MFITNVTDFLFTIVVSCNSGKSKRSDVSNDKDEDDEGSVDGGGMFNDPNFKKALKTASQGGIIVGVSKPFKHGDEVKYVVVFENEEKGPRMYFLKGPHYCELLAMRTEDRKTPFAPTNPFTFEETVQGINLRDSPSSTTSRYQRVGTKNKTVEVTIFTVTLPYTERSNIGSVLELIMNDYFKYLFARKRNLNTAGELALNYAKQLLPENAKPGSGLYGHLVQRYGDGNSDTAAKHMTAEINKYWKRDITYVYDCHLDKYMVNYDIKKWAQYNLGATSWDDLDDRCKKACFKSYPRRDIPEWDGIVQESYQSCN
ncbi:hypothetical protein N9140_00035 [bacterium]|nr:hypothetical protein [bacterium]